MKKKGVFFGWVVVLGCIMLRAGIGVASFSLGGFVIPVSRALGVTRSAYLTYQTLTNLATMFMLPFLGVWFKKRNFKLLMWLGVVVTGGSLFCYSFIWNLWSFYALAILNGLFIGMINSIPIVMLMSNWFVEKRGLAIGLAFAGSGISSMLVTPLTTTLIESMGWQQSFRVLGLIFFVLTIIPMVLFIRVRPEDRGLMAFGATKESQAAAQTGYTSGQALRSPAFWLIGAAMFLTGFAFMGIQSNVIPFLTDMGHSAAFAAQVFAILMGVELFGKLIMGAIYDKKGMKFGNVYICGLFFCSALLLFFAKSPAVCILFAVFFGLTMPIQTGTYPIVISTLMGERDYSQIYGNLTICYYAGMSLGVPSTALFYDTCGSYLPAWGIFVLLTVVIVVLLFLAGRAAAREAVGQRQEA